MSDPLGLISGAGGVRPPTPRPAQPGQEQGPAFKDVLMKNIEHVDKLSHDAATAIEDLSAGRRDDVAQVMNAARKAELAFEALQQVRNKMVTAYQEIKDIRV